MKKIKQNKGITLIALVVTIVILLILAGITIGTLTNDNGVIKEANLAKAQAERTALEEQIEAAILIAEQKYRNPTLKQVIIEIEKIDTVKRVNEDNGNIENKIGEPIVGKLDDYLDKDEEKSIIPEGFYHVGGTIEDGFVISDVQGDDLNNSKGGNQFVWIPVPDINNFKRIAGYHNKSQQSLDGYAEPATNGYEGESTDYTNMYNSVRDNHGFYIGRFEAGNDGSNNVVVKKGVDVYNNIGWNASGNMNDETGGAVEKAKEFASKQGYTSVTSTLVYGVQWDAVMQFIDSKYINGECDEDSYVRNSTEKGWYKNNCDSTDKGNKEPNPDHITGLDLIYNSEPNVIANKQKNIYDMAGNVWEWTMEANSTNFRVTRGDGYDVDDNIYRSFLSWLRIFRCFSCRHWFSPCFIFIVGLIEVKFQTKACNKAVLKGTNVEKLSEELK